MKNIKLNKKGLNIGELKEYLSTLPEDMVISDTIVVGDTTFSTPITEMYTTGNELVLISLLTREQLDKKL